MAEHERSIVLGPMEEALEPKLDVGPAPTLDSLTKEDITVICAWCKTTMRVGTTEATSHGMCDTCKQSLMADATSSTVINAADGTTSSDAGDN